MAVMLARGDLALEADIRSDTAPLGGLVEDAARRRAGDALAARPDPRRASAPCATSWPRDTDLAVVLDEAALPVDPAVIGACDLLGIDPLYVANEGKVRRRRGRPTRPTPRSPRMRAHPLGADAARIGEMRGRARGRSSCCSRPSAAPGSSTCSSATRCPASAERRPSP